MKRTPVPKYRRQREKGQDRAFVVLGGRRIYLGGYDTPESRQRYARAIAEWEAGGSSPLTGPHGLTVAELVAEFWTHAERHYGRPSGGTTSEIDCYRQAVRPLVRLYGDTSAAAFGPRSLKAVRQAMIDTGWGRPYVNAQVARIKRLFKWGVAEELVLSSILHGLQAVAGLQAGRTEAHEPKPVMPVDDRIVNATLQHMTPTVAAMVQVQRLTGMRPGEVCAMTTGAIDVDGKVWVYTPEFHKTQYRGRSRRILLGPKAKDVIRPFLRIGLEDYLFSPKRADQERREIMHANRVTPMSCGNTPGSNQKRRPSKQPGERYHTRSYHQAIVYACDQAWPIPDDIKANSEAVTAWRHEHRWAPNQLRHSYATRVRRDFGVDLAGTMLGHAAGSTITAVYAERSESLARAVAVKIG